MKETESVGIEVLASSVSEWENTRRNVKAATEAMESAKRSYDQAVTKHKKAVKAFEEAEQRVRQQAKSL